MEVPIQARLLSARRSPNRAIRHAVAVAATALLCIGVTSAPVWAAAPSNDELAGAIPVSLGDHITANTTEATTTAGDAALASYCGESVADATAWYTYTPSVGSGLDLDATGSSYSTHIMVFDGTPGPGTIVGCGQGAVSRISAQVGRTYTVLVFDDQSDGDAANGGTLVLDVIDGGPLPSVKVVLDSRAQVDKSGSVAVTGTYTCTGAARWELDLQLHQLVGRLMVQGYGAIPYQDGSTCDGTPKPFTLQVPSDNGKFAGGKATAYVFTDECDAGWLCNDERTVQTIQLVKAR